MAQPTNPSEKLDFRLTPAGRVIKLDAADFAGIRELVVHARKSGVR
jgi:hypothetical protein